MPSPLVHHAYKLNQKLNDCLFHYCLHWNVEIGEWKQETDWKRQVHYYIFHFFLMGLLMPSITAFVFYSAVFIPKALPLESTIIFVMISLTFPVSIFVDFFFFYYGHDFLAIINWVDQQVDAHLMNRRQITEPCKLGNPTIFIKGSRNIKTIQLKAKRNKSRFKII